MKICHLYYQSFVRGVGGQDQTRKNPFFVNSEFLEYRFGGKKTQITTNFKLRQNSVNEIFNPCAYAFSSF